MKLSDQVVNRIQDAIVRGDYATGQRLPTEGELAATMEVSRTVIRDAFRTLASMGLVVIRQGDGTYVAAPNDHQVRQALALRLHRSDLTIGEVISARKTIESAIAHEAAIVGDPEDWDRMQRALDQFTFAVSMGDWGRANVAHLKFHLGLIEAVHEPALSITMQPMHELIVISSLPPETDRVDLWEVELHEPMLTALRSGDASAARAATRAHYAYIDRPEYAEFSRTLFRQAHAVASFAQVIGSYRDLQDSLVGFGL